jgi:hypothetical protein
VLRLGRSTTARRARSSSVAPPADAHGVNLSPLTGMQAAMQLFDGAATAIASAPQADDLITPMVDLITAPLAYDANARVLEAQDAMTRSLLDLVA